MLIGWPADLSWYKLLTDWGSILGGLLALVAGILAYRAGIRQAKEARAQSKQLRQQERRQIARTSLSACRLFEGALKTTKSEINRVLNLLMQPAYAAENVGAPASLKGIVSLPPLETIWDDLGLFTPDVIQTYLSLDRYVHEFRNDGVYGAGVLRDRLRRFDVQIDFLLTEIAAESKRTTATLAELLESEQRAAA